MHQVHFILLTLISVFLIGCINANRLTNLNNNLATKSINPINPKIERTKAEFFLNKSSRKEFSFNDVQSYNIQTHPDQLIQSRQLAYQKVLTNRLVNFGIQEYYLNGNGVVFITEHNSINTLDFRDFIRSGFCPIVNDLAIGFGQNRRVIMLDITARQGRYLDYSNEICSKVVKMTLSDANRYLFPQILAY